MSKILIVDDEDQIRQLISFVCNRAGHQVDAVGDGLEAAYLLQKENYDLLITDMSMVPLSGHELMQLARMNCPQTKVIAVSGWVTPEAQTKAEKNGADRYLCKPFNFDSLIQVIDELSVVN